MKTKREEARLLSYTLLYNRSGNLVTERTSTDISELEKYFSKEEYSTLQTVIREATSQLDKVHNYIEANLNGRYMKN
jgi:NADH:ubiquinone oxidoreductase subunit F (NADH-binding)